jgi:putative ABC transport system permease protein
MKTFLNGFSQFRTHPLRTFLTLLGMVFGVGSVVAMVSIGEGAQRQILANIEAMGSQNTHIKARPVAPDKLGDMIQQSAGLSRQDALAITRSIPSISTVGWRSRVAVAISDLRLPLQTTPVLGVSAHLPTLHGLRIAQGRGLLPLDHFHGRRVAVLGATTAKRAFPAGAVGQRFRLDYAWFEVVGVLEARSHKGGDLPIDPAIYDKAVMIPYQTAIEEIQPAPLYSELELITVGTAGIEATLGTKRILQGLFRHLHGGVEDVDFIAPEEILREREATQRVLNIVLICIAAISLLVGGIGVMNIMLANIMERVSEIGLRRAVGATRMDIQRQFLTEAIVICCVGGILGIILGYAIAYGVAFFVNYPAAFAWVSMLFAFGISTLVGIIFGYVPARRAANVNPIEALHSD